MNSKKRFPISVIVSCLASTIAIGVELITTILSYKYPGYTTGVHILGIILYPAWAVAIYATLKQPSWGWMALIASSYASAVHAIGLQAGKGGLNFGLLFLALGLLTLASFGFFWRQSAALERQHDMPDAVLDKKAA